MSTTASVTVKSKIHFLFFPPPCKKHFQEVVGGYIHGGEFVDERDQGPSCCEQFVFYPRDREG
jgi:hypothetical protein